MDKISIAGLLIAVATIVGGQLMEGGNVASLLQPTAFLIVIGGTLGAVLLQSPYRVFMRGLRMLRWIIFPPETGAAELIGKITRWSVLSRREGLLALEPQINALQDPFQRKGLQLLVDGLEPSVLRETLELDIDSLETELKRSAKIWDAAGGYAPTIGILGAVMGLIHVMENLADPAKLGSGIAVAFVATIYGVGSANLILLPVARKLMSHVADLVNTREMYIDGLVAIANGENPRIIEMRLRGFWH